MAMGWLCPDCGSENPFSERQCRACGREIRARFRVQEMACACAERLLHGGWYGLAEPPAMARTNRLTQRGVRASAAFLAAFSIWCGLQTVRAEGTDIAFRRVSSAAEAAGVRAASQMHEAAQACGTDGEAALQQFSAACGEAGDRINSAGPWLLFHELEIAEPRAGTRMSLLSAGIGDSWESGGGIGPVVRAVHAARWTMSSQTDRFYQEAVEAWQQGSIVGIVTEALEMLKMPMD